MEKQTPKLHVEGRFTRIVCECTEQYSNNGGYLRLRFRGSRLIACIGQQQASQLIWEHEKVIRFEAMNRPASGSYTLSSWLLGKRVEIRVRHLYRDDIVWAAVSFVRVLL